MQAKENPENGKHWGSILFIVFWILLAATTAFQIITNPDITFETHAGMIQELSSICITINSITLATLAAVFSIIVIRKPDISIAHIPAEYASIPIDGILISLMTSYFSHMKEDFVIAKWLLGIAIMLTVVGIIALYVMLRWQKQRLFATYS
ncbi:MAG TPA: hypothetical protein VMT31_02645 [Methanomicrobiales archaeon]|jgi:hypothetical protein|nr:hypothetical protein [Methanomicrobiales archaeon]